MLAQLPDLAAVLAGLEESLSDMPAPVHDADPIRFNWFAQWYPVLPLSYLEGDKPTKLKLLGLDIVLWPDQEGTWRAGRDQCPHRCVRRSLLA